MKLRVILALITFQIMINMPLIIKGETSYSILLTVLGILLAPLVYFIITALVELGEKK